MRDASRRTWMRHLQPTHLRAHFVLRGQDLPDEAPVWSEARTYGDVLFLNASDSLSRQVGPLASLYLWLECAAWRYPEVPYVGKMDDDTWLQAAGIDALLVNTLPWVDRPWAVYMGRFECYSWNATTDGPLRWRPAHNYAGCKRNTEYPVIGPFGFAKGGANFLSSRLARHITGSQRASVARLTQMGHRCVPGSAQWGAHGSSSTKEPKRSTCQHAALTAWEDVWTGFVLSQGATGPMMLLDLHEHVIDSWGLMARSSVLAWHSRMDASFGQRATLLDDWAAASPLCDWTRAPLPSLTCVDVKTAEKAPAQTCAGQPLVRCAMGTPPTCDSKLVDILRSNNRTRLPASAPKHKY